MCGIAGIIGIKNPGLAKQKISEMNECLKHRGPDAEGTFVDKNIALGHRRLSIIDLSPESNQPFTDSDGRYVITFNGEIYNFREIRQQLKDYPFKTNSDTEVLLAAYQRFGETCLSMLNGMYAFAIWDKNLQKLFCARDRLGVKPFYFCQTADGKFIFASEIRSILSTGLIARRISKKGLQDYLMFQSVYAPNTIVKNIQQLNAGEYGIYENKKFTIKRYWKLEQNRDFPSRNFSETKSTIKNLLLESVQRRMISDVPLGAFLSGGIDSSAVVALMSEISSQPINTFSVTFDEKKFDESEYADLIAKKYKTDHQTIRLSPKDFLDSLPEALKAIDSPSGDGLNTYIVSKATRNSGITVALSGVGGDELFAGYEYFKTWLNLKQGFLPKIPNFIKFAPGLILSRSNNSKYQRIADILSSRQISISEIYPILRQVLSPTKINELVLSNGYEPTITGSLREKLFDIEKLPLLSQFSVGELFGYTQNVLLKDTDQFSMASALEVREPFFDYKLVEYVLSVPDKYKYPQYPKSLLVESIAPMLPDQIVHRKKMGFVLPWENWMRNELKDFCQERVELLSEMDLVNNDNLLKNWQDFLARKKGILWSHIWHLVVLTEWLKNNKF
jgi:asparagine synthase (glutamine-hydrolysing)